MGIASKRSDRHILTVINYSSRNLEEIAGVQPPENPFDGKGDEPYPGSELQAADYSQLDGLQGYPGFTNLFGSVPWNLFGSGVPASPVPNQNPIGIPAVPQTQQTSPGTSSVSLNPQPEPPKPLSTVPIIIFNPTVPDASPKITVPTQPVA